METKIFEVRDRMTFIPVMATRVLPLKEGQGYLLSRAGYGPDEPPLIILTQLAGGRGLATCDPHDWGSGSRTMKIAHEHIRQHWNNLADGGVIDVEHILGETEMPKTSERWGD
jgi:hypothetical protein